MVWAESGQSVLSVESALGEMYFNAYIYGGALVVLVLAAGVFAVQCRIACLVWFVCRVAST